MAEANRCQSWAFSFAQDSTASAASMEYPLLETAPDMLQWPIRTAGPEPHCCRKDSACCASQSSGRSSSSQCRF